MSAAVTIRKCESLEEMQACFALQQEVWHFSDADLVPVRLFVVANKIGGQVVGAFDDRELVGFALGIPGNLPEVTGASRSVALGSWVWP